MRVRDDLSVGIESSLEDVVCKVPLSVAADVHDVQAEHYTRSERTGKVLNARSRTVARNFRKCNVHLHGQLLPSALVDNDGRVRVYSPVVHEFHRRECEDNGGRNNGHCEANESKWDSATKFGKIWFALRT